MAGGGAPGLPLRNGLPSDDIQGDILAGFNKDYRMYFFLKFPSQQRGRAWLKELTRQKLVVSTRTVATFNERFSSARAATGGYDPDIKAVWLGVSFTFAGLQLLAKDGKQLEIDLQNYAAFKNGPVGNLQNNGVRDTTKANALGDAGTFSGPETWLFGGIDEQGHDKNTIHALLNIQADDANELTTELEKMRALAAEYAVEIVYEQRGATLTGERSGHEHFGFKDGISQPGVDGFDVRDNANDDDDPSDRLGQVAGHPGTAIIAGGEFILGETPEPAPVIPPLAEPATLDTNKLGWMKNGAFQVFRRLEQDVPAFWGQITKNAHSLPSDDPMLAELLAAKIVGRWRSGTPIDLAPERDDRFTHNPVDDNNFHFFEKDANGNVLKDSQGHPLDDEKGLRCPRFAHIRKVYPRANNFAGSRHRRIIRRGVPFGLPFDPANGTGHGADADRGLLFVAYMRSIADQFEFLQQQWVDNTQFPFGVPATNVTINGEPVTASGPDPIIGTSFTRADDVSTGVPLTAVDEQNAILLRRDTDTLLNFQRFVHTTGSLYTFVPSISTLASLANGDV